MRKVLLVTFVGMVLVMCLYGLAAEHVAENTVNGAATVVYVE